MSAASSRGVSDRRRGQILPLTALALVALLVMVSLIIDGGNAYAQQRITQNGADAAAEAGAVVLMRKLVGVAGLGDADVETAVQTSATANGLETPVLACYTNLAGIPLATDGTTLVDCTGAAQVGDGIIPTCSECPEAPNGVRGAPGVRVYGSRAFGTYFARVVGINTFTATTTATAISGFVDTYGGPVIPVTFPVIPTECDGTGKAVRLPGEEYPTGPGNIFSLPLCGNAPGNVGWLDWDPQDGQGGGDGTNELACAILGQSNCANPTIITPRWYYVAQTGNVNASLVQNAMDHWIGTDVMLPIFDATCNTTPSGIDSPPFEITDCPTGNLGGNGQQQWYYLVGFAKWHVVENFIQGQDTAHVCDAYDLEGGNGMTSCLIGYFVNDTAVSLGASVGAGGGSSTFTSPPGVQLIR